MTCEDKRHKHMDDPQIDSMIKSCIKDHVKSIRTVQEVMHKAGICENDFFTILVNLAVHIGAEAILHLERSSDLPKQEAINMILGGIARKVGSEFITINVPHRTPANVTAH